MCEFLNAFVCVVHCQADSPLALEVIHLHPFLLATLAGEEHFEGAWFLYSEICGFVLIPECVSSDYDGVFPPRDESGDIADDDWFSKHSAVEYVSDGPIGTFPHFL